MELASLAQLELSHRRHDEVIAELLEAARRLAAGRPDGGDLERVRAAVAYFERAATRHFVDEDGSVFPRLSTRRPELSAQLAALSAEHPAQIAMQAEIAEAARSLVGEARPSAGKVLLDAVTRLAEVHRAHVDREDQIFAAAHKALTAEDDAEIVAEMETRREREDGTRRAPAVAAAPASRAQRRPATARSSTKVAPDRAPATRKAKPRSTAARAAAKLTTKRAPAARKAKPRSTTARTAAKLTTKRAPAAARKAKPAKHGKPATRTRR